MVLRPSLYYEVLVVVSMVPGDAVLLDLIHEALDGFTDDLLGLATSTHDPASAEDIPDLLDTTGDSMVESSQDGGAYHFYIRKAG